MTQAPWTITGVKSLADRLKWARKRLDISQGELAKRAGVSQGTIGNAESGTRERPRELLSIAEALGVNPWWLETGRGSPEVGGAREFGAIAQPVSLASANVIPLVTLGHGMEEDLPPVFRVEAPDDSMAPRIKAGTVVSFDTGIQPKPGDGVLVKDASGSAHIRVFRQLRGARWEARPLNDAFEPMTSDEDGLTILAVLVAVASRWSEE